MPFDTVFDVREQHWWPGGANVAFFTLEEEIDGQLTIKETFFSKVDSYTELQDVPLCVSF